MIDKEKLQGMCLRNQERDCHSINKDLFVLVYTKININVNNVNNNHRCSFHL